MFIWQKLKLLNSNIMDKEYSLIWEGHVQHVRDSFSRLLENSDTCDVTLYTEGQKIGAHKVFLKACSGYFNKLFEDLKNEHAIIVLKGIKFDVLQQILKFIYRGQVNIETDKLEAFLDAADFLKVYGLTERALHKRGHSITTETDTSNKTEFERSCTPRSVSPNILNRSAEECREYSEHSQTGAECSISLDSVNSGILCNFKNKNAPVISTSLSETGQHNFYSKNQIQAMHKTHCVSLHDEDVHNNNKDNEMSTTSSFCKPMHRKYSLDSPTRTGEWTSDYDNCFTNVQESVQQKMIDPPDEEILHSIKKIKVKHERLSTELEEMRDAESFGQSTIDSVIEVSDEDDNDDSPWRERLKSNLL